MLPATTLGFQSTSQDCGFQIFLTTVYKTCLALILFWLNQNIFLFQKSRRVSKWEVNSIKNPKQTIDKLTFEIVNAPVNQMNTHYFKGYTIDTCLLFFWLINKLISLKKVIVLSGDTAELANNTLIFGLRDLGSNLGTDKKKFWFCLYQVWIQICGKLTLNHLALILFCIKPNNGTH
jgi:hypothetical protein